MYNHAPPDYVCPFCLIGQGIENAAVYTVQSDVIYRDEIVTAFIAVTWWPNNPGHVLVIPNAHFENIFDLPLHLGGEIFRVSQQIAIAFKQVYGCDGVSTRQHNESAGNQEVWHYHQHVFPRYTDDQLYQQNRCLTTSVQRLPYAQKLRQALNWQS